MNAETLLPIVVLVAAGVFILQCLSVWLAFRKVRQVAERVEKQAEDLKKELKAITATTREVVENFKPLSGIFEDIQSNASFLSETIRERGQDLDQFVQEMLQSGRDQAAKIDYVVTDTVQKFEEVTEAIQKDVLRPALEISSFVKAIKSGLDYLFTNRKSSPPTERSPEEEVSM